MHKLIIGTQTSGNEPNYLSVCKVRLPKENFDLEKETSKKSAEEMKQDVKIEYEVKMNHQGDVNKALPNPKRNNLIASKTDSGEVHVFDYHKHKSRPEDSIVKPELKLLGHEKEGFGLSWHPTELLLASGSNDSKVCVWDLTKKDTSGSLFPILTFTEHTDVCEDVCFSPDNPNLLASVGDDRMFILYDIRDKVKVTSFEAHLSDINSVDINPLNGHQILTASSDKTVALWDDRKLTTKMHSYEHHTAEVMGARWNPNLINLFASFGADRRVHVWDLSKQGEDPGPTDLEDGPAELLFTHGGHTAEVRDLSWNLNENLVCASVSTDNMIHLWEMVME